MCTGASGGRRPSSRPAVNLAHTRGLTAPTLQRRARLREEFSTWILQSFGFDWDTFVLLDPVHVSRALAQYGQWMFDSYRSRGDYAELINAVVDSNRSLRFKLEAAWDVCFAWRYVIPGQNHLALPEALFLALLALALQWNWYDMAGCLMVSLG